MGSEWFAVVGIAVGYDQHLGALTEAIRIVRAHAFNRDVAVLVGGPLFAARPEVAQEVGADATASNAPLAVLAAQKIFDLRARSGKTAKG